LLVSVELLADALRDLCAVGLVLDRVRLVRGTVGWGWVGVFGTLLGPERTRAVQLDAG
jgi:hypothetical protein